ncbi:MAG: 30S ribosomal protein S13 [Candidatus Abawacabacteria bacterium RIFCSPHIGHO2_01_FULL_46_8]|uniref:Small ribosomal subunit protein uS13 n=1 Tax=Candidatus Abawacabacteria bacterium RIFCSPHIGHO2_01_FULL_46_8 TaxID=1817815 RepID=A0A1F4XKP0_9BACT|nr:MAG: 30S ribosomal protein S13 [Candidatus Abawacabacteria bacterium RIFCSPHIGHO2_01_FULL_46_8]
MARIVGVNLPDKKRVEIGLTYIYGIGRSLSNKILAEAKISPDLRISDLTDQDIAQLKLLLDQYTIEGDLRRQVSINVRRLQDINSYRGTRHKNRLPVRGQRTKTNARTKRGKKRTVGSGKKTETKT